MRDANEIDLKSAPFNFAIDTLQRIADILETITALSINETMFGDIAMVQYRKWKAVKQLYLASFPLITKPEDKAKIKHQFEQVKLNTKSDSRNSESPKLIYSHEVDKQLDNVIEEIERILQKDKYFMPPKDDLRFKWKQK